MLPFLPDYGFAHGDQSLVAQMAADDLDDAVIVGATPASNRVDLIDDDHDFYDRGEDDHDDACSESEVQLGYVYGKNELPLSAWRETTIGGEPIAESREYVTHVKEPPDLGMDYIGVYLDGTEAPIPGYTFTNPAKRLR